MELVFIAAEMMDILGIIGHIMENTSGEKMKTMTKQEILDKIDRLYEAIDENRDEIYAMEEEIYDLEKELKNHE